MKKPRALILFIVFLSFSVRASFLSSLYGHGYHGRIVQVGAYVYHFRRPRKKVFFPYLTLVHNNYVYGLFENSSLKLGAFAGIQRYWYQHGYDNGSGIRVGYQLGVIYGYCMTSSLLCHPHDHFPKTLKLIPGFLLFTQYFFNSKIGISVSWAGVIVKSDLIYRW